jgi:hypothetical protein
MFCRGGGATVSDAVQWQSKGVNVARLTVVATHRGSHLVPVVFVGATCKFTQRRGQRHLIHTPWQGGLRHVLVEDGERFEQWAVWWRAWAGLL